MTTKLIKRTIEETLNSQGEKVEKVIDVEAVSEAIANILIGE